MASQTIILFDTNVIIEYFKGNEAVCSKVKSIGEANIYISSITASELYFGALNKRELQQIQKKLDLIIRVPVNESISELAEELVYKYSLSHKLAVPDSLIAATALYYEMELFTFNKKDFRYITGLKLI